MKRPGDQKIKRLILDKVQVYLLSGPCLSSSRLLSIQPYLPGRGAALPVSPAETPPRPHTCTHAPTPIHTCAHTCTAPCVCYQEDGLPSAETALLLHRKGFDCGLEAKNLGFNCTTSQGKVSRAPVWEGSRGQGNITRHSGHRAH